MSARTKARKRAVDALFAANLRSVGALELLESTRTETSDRQNQEEIFSYANSLVSGYLDNRETIDNRLENYSDGWKLSRMPGVDLAIMRISCFELLFNDEVPDAVAISEAQNLAEEYSTESSAKFITGILNQIAKSKQAL